MEDRCVCCGAIVLEGHFVCPACEIKAFSEKENVPKPKRIGLVRKLLRYLEKKDCDQ